MATYNPAPPSARTGCAENRLGGRTPARSATLVLNLTDLLAALALLLVIEGIIPFLSPGVARRALARVLEAGDNELRIAGLASMLVGLAILYLVR
jgi:uncharacterized protein